MAEVTRGRGILQGCIPVPERLRGIHVSTGSAHSPLKEDCCCTTIKSLVPWNDRMWVANTSS